MSYTDSFQTLVNLKHIYPQVQSIVILKDKIGLKVLTTSGKVDTHYFKYNKEDVHEASQSLLKFLEQYD